uniref:SpoU_methylase domain-containing protein n=1 Tax=Mesocestoides corti TaxID=53468 RepID=A0A5K3FBE1_MESCO
MVESMPYHLLCFLLRWVASSGHEVAAFARRSVLGAVTAIVKRAAAAQAESHVAGLSLGGSAHARGPPTLTWPPFSNPGPPNCLVTFFLDELSHLLAPVSASYQQESSRLSFGLAILSAFLDEMNDSDQDAASLNLSLESHVYLQARFQAFELLQIFQILLRLVESLIRVHDWPTPNLNNDETTYHLVHCFEVITSWNFLPEHIVDFTCLRPTMRRTRNFRPCDRWECVFGVRGISLTLSLLLKLHSHLRSVPTFSCRILTSVVALTSLTGPLVSGHTNSPLAEHVSICMSGLARSLTPLAADPLSGVTALLVSQTEPRADDLNLYAEGVVPYSRLAEVEAAFPVFPSTGFHSYELPLLAEMGVNLLRRLVDVCTVLEGFAVGMGWPTTGGEDVLSRLFFYLSAMDAFLGLVKNILLKCLLLEAGVGGTDGDVDVEDQVTAAHEASERLFAYLSDISNVVPRFASSDSAISFTTGPTAVRDQMMEVLKRACVKVRANFQRHQRELIKAYFSSHLAAPIGFRKDSTNGGSGGATNEEFDLDIDDDDQMAYEDSLFTIGQFSSSAEGNAMASVVELLVGLLEERVVLLANSPAPDNCNVTLLEDVHWLLLFVGHVLVTGPSKLGASKGAQPAWDSDFSIPSAVWSTGPETFTSEEFERCHQYLVKATENTPFTGPQSVPSLLRLFGVLFRLLSLQVSSRIGSAQLTEDSLWVFVRLTLTYFSSNNPNGHLEDCEVESTNEQLSLLRALLRPPTSNHYSAPGFSCAENVTSALILAARLAMSTWLGEPKITAMASCLLAVIARHSLVSASLSKENANPTRSWIELCGLVCGPNATVDTWPSLLPETLTELVDTCARGCWCLRASTCSDVGVHNGNNVVNLFYQVR